MARFISTQPLPSTLNFQAQQAAKSALLTEAASLVPDAEKLVDRLNTYELTPIKRKEFNQVVMGETNDFVTKYTQDPFYAFSRGGRNQLKKLQNVVNSAALGQEEGNYDTLKEVWENSKDVAGEYNIENGRIMIWDGQRRRRVSLDDFDPEKHHALTVQDDRTLAENQLGATGFLRQSGGDIPTYNLTDITDVNNTIRRQIDAVEASTKEWTEFGEYMDFENKSSTNVPQLQTRVEAIMGNLNDVERNTLMSQYFKQYGSQATLDGFQPWLQRQIVDYAQGKESSVDSRKAKKGIMFGVQKDLYDMAAGASFGDEVAAGNLGTANFVFNTSTQPSIQAMRVPIEGFLDRQSGPGIEDLNGNKTTSILVKDIEFLNSSGTRDMYIATPNLEGAPEQHTYINDGVKFENNDFIKVEDSGARDIIGVQVNKESGYHSYPVDRQGRPAPAHVYEKLTYAARNNDSSVLSAAELAEYTFLDDNGKRQVTMNYFWRGSGMVPVEKELWGGGDLKRYKGTVEKLEKRGLNFGQDEHVMNLYNNRSGYNKEIISTQGINDGYYEVDMMIPVNPNMFGEITGSTLRSSKEAQFIGSHGSGPFPGMSFDAISPRRGNVRLPQTVRNRQ